MSKFLKIKKKYLYTIIITAAVTIGGLYFFTKNGNGGEIITVKKGAVIQSVLATGKIKAVENVDLGFENSGKVSDLYINVGDRVEADQILAKLDSDELYADLNRAQANVSLKRAQSGGTATKLDEVKKEQDTLVQSAYTKLLSDDLIVTSNLSYGVTAPTLTGLYSGPEGEYKLRVLRKLSSSNTYELRVLGLENADFVEILDNDPTPVGTNGLFISFSDGLSNYNDTTWYVSIPNKKGSSYLDNYSAYSEAVRTRARTIAEAESQLTIYNGGITVATAELQSAEADVLKIQSQIAQNTIRAPFAGIVTKRDVEKGEIVSPNTPIISIVSDNNLEIEAFVSEINIGKVAVGNPVSFTLDAYQEEVFNGVVSYVDPGETLIDDVVNYKVKVSINDDLSVKSGLTANLTFITLEKTDAVIVPQYSIVKEGKEMFVNKVSKDGKIVKTSIKTGVIGQGGDTEVISGLSVGDLIQADVKN